MEITSAKWRNTVIDGARMVGVEMDREMAEKCAVHAFELMRWNAKVNLTSITDPYEIAIKHYVDSLACIPFIEPESHILDIGSGGGFPGIPIAIAAPPSSVVMIDASRKKISFINAVIARLGLRRAKGRHLRIENVGEDTSPQDDFTVIVCRAFSRIDQFFHQIIPLLHRQGKFIALKGKAAETRKELADLQKIPSFEDRFDIGVNSYTLPFIDDQRTIVTVTYKR